MENDMLHQIMALDFCLNDLGMYLDTHPNDKETIEMYNDYKKECAELKKLYEQKSGPIMQGTTNPAMWNWLDNPWPWENMFK